MKIISILYFRKANNKEIIKQKNKTKNIARLEVENLNFELDKHKHTWFLIMKNMLFASMRKQEVEDETKYWINTKRVLVKCPLLL